MVADQIEDHVVVFAPACEVIAAVVDDVVGTERAHEFGVACACDRGHFCADRFGDLHGECAHSPGCAVDQNLLARLETARVSQPEERGHAGERHRRRLAEVRLAGIRASSRAGAAT